MRHAGRRWIGSIGAAGALALGAFGGGAPAAAAGCPNEAIREAQGSTGLPECRAYEQVSPGKGSAILSALSQFEASDDGNSVVFEPLTPLPGSRSGLTAGTRFTRGTSGWLRLPDAVPNPVEPVDNLTIANVLPFPDLGSGLIEANAGARLAPNAPTPEPGSVAPRFVRNLYAWDGGESVIPINGLPATPELEEIVNGEGQYAAYGAGASPSLDRIIFSAPGTLAPGAPGFELAGTNLYEWHDGQVSPIGRLPDGEIADGSAVGASGIYGTEPFAWGAGLKGAITFSEAGPSIYFNAPVGPEYVLKPTGQLYLSRPGTATVEVSASTRVPADPRGPFPAQFQFASLDGRLAFFTSNAELTADADTGTEPIEASSEFRSNLYRYDSLTGQLVDLTVPSDPASAGVGAGVGAVLGASDDGSTIYFFAQGDLDRAGRGRVGEDNIYAYHDGVIDLVASGEEGAGPGYGGLPVSPSGGIAAATSPNGRYFAFRTPVQLTGYDNEGVTEVYVYSLASGTISCVSCRFGAPAVREGSFSEKSLPSDPLHVLTGAEQFVTDAGQVFFSTAEPLLPGTDNGAVKVYEWRDGSVQKLSSGSAPDLDTLVGVRNEGRDVFLVSRQSLVAADQDGGAADLYDVRVEGGFAEAKPTAACGEGSCRPESEPPPGSGGAASAGLSGRGFDGPPCGSFERRAAKLRKHAAGARRKKQRAKARQWTRRSLKLRKEARLCRGQEGS